MTATLVLNASFEPLCVVPYRRAVVLVLVEKAVLVESDGFLRSGRCVIELPSVIRLNRYVRVPYRARLAFSKRAVLLRDGYICAYCGGKAGTVDHVVPKALGGVDDFGNTVAACSPCNNKKGHKTLIEMGWVLAHTPTDPVGVGGIIRGYRAPTPEWEPYLRWGTASATA